MALLEVRDLRVAFTTADGVVQAVRGLSFDVERGSTLAIVGESGSGKSVATQTIAGLTRGARVTGTARFDGIDLIGADPEVLRRVRGRPDRDDLPGPAVEPAPLLHGGVADRRDDPRAPRRVTKAAAQQRAAELLTLVGIPHAPAADRRLPPPVLRRHAAARDDRHGDGARPGAAHRRRADHGPGRDGPGAGARRDAQPPGASSARRSS